MTKQFEIDQLNLNCDYIIEFCVKNNNDEYRPIIDNCNELLKSAKFVNQFAFDYTFEGIPSNGFVTYLKIITSYTDVMANQIKRKHKIDEDLIKLFKIINWYGEIILNTYNDLKEEEGRFDFKSILTYEDKLANMNMYKNLRSNFDEKPLTFSKYAIFYSTEFQRLIKLINFCFAFAYKVPSSSILSLCSSKYRGKYSFKTMTNANIQYPFSVWHQTERWPTVKFLSACLNIKVPVKSKTLKVPKQARFRLDCKGNILDFDKMTKKEIESYFNDKEEQERQNAPGLRHRNKDTIRCRYSYITSKNKIIESLEIIEKAPEPFKALEYYSARKVANSQSKPIECVNQVEDLNIYEANDLIKDKIKFKIKKNKSKYSGPNYEEQTIDNEFKNVPLNIEENNNDESISKDDFNKKKILILYLHGGGFFTQGNFKFS